MKKPYIIGIIIFLFSSLSAISQNLSDGLLAWYKLDYNIADSSGHKNDGTPLLVTPTSDRFGNSQSAYLFEGYYTPGEIQVASSPSLNVDKAMSFSAWVRVDSLSGMDGNGVYVQNGYQTIFAKSGDQTGGAFMMDGTKSQLTLSLQGATITDTVFFDQSALTNKLQSWMHVVLTVTDTTEKIYIDNQLVSEFKGSFPIANFNDKGLSFGRFNNSSWYPLNGALDNIRIYSRELATTDVEALYYEFPPYVIVGNTKICNSDESACKLNVIANGATLIKWENEQAIGSSTTFSPSGTTNGQGSYYYVDITYPNKIIRDSVLVQVYYKVDINIQSSKSTICSGDSVTIKASGADFYKWYEGDSETPLASNVDSIVVSPKSTTTYNVDPNGCYSGRTSVPIGVNAIPVISITPSKSKVCEGDSLKLLAKGAASYAWSNGGETDSIVVKPKIGDVFTVTGTSTEGCVGVNFIKDNGDLKWSVTTASSFITSSTIDNKGNIWDIENNVLQKFDGSQWIPYPSSGTLGYTSLESVIADPHGNIWLNSDSGVYRYNGVVWKKFFANPVMKLQSDRKGNIWVLYPGIQQMMAMMTMANIGTQSTFDVNSTKNLSAGIYKFDGKSWENYTPSDLTITNITNIQVDTAGNPWIVYYSGYDSQTYQSIFTIEKYDGTSWVSYDTSNYSKGLASTLMSSDTKGNMWFSGKGVFYKTDGKIWQTVETPDVTNDDINSFIVDKNDNIWASYKKYGINDFSGYSGLGLSKYSNNSWYTYTNTTDGLAENYVYAIYPDASGNIYAQGEQTISRYGIPFEIHASPKVSISLLPQSHCITQPIMLTANGSDIYQWDNDEVTSQISIQPTTSTVFKLKATTLHGCSSFDSVSLFVPRKIAIFPSKTNVCQGSTLGLVAIGGVTPDYSWSTGEQNDSIVVPATLGTQYSVTAIDENGCLSIASIKGNDTQSWKRYATTDYINSSTVDHNGNIWAVMGGEGYELKKYDGQNWISYNSTDIDVDYSNPEIVSTDALGNVWLAANSGLYKFDGKTWNKVFDYEVSILQPDNKGSMWIYSASENSTGISKYTGSTWEDYTPSSDILDPSSILYLTIDAKGYPWITYSYGDGQNGIAKYDGQKWTMYDQVNYPAGLNSSPYLAADTLGNVWFAGKKILYKTDGASWQSYPIPDIGNENPMINAFFVDKSGALWLSYLNGGGYSVGLAQYQSESDSWNTYIAASNTIADDYINVIYQDVNGTIYAQAQNSISTNSYSYVINAKPVTSILSTPASICKSEPVTLLAKGGAAYEWKSEYIANQMTVTPDSTTTYQVKVTTRYGCSSTDSIKIIVPKTKLTASKDTICVGDTVTLIASGGKSYMWNVGSQTDTVVVSPTTTTKYNVFILTENGCSYNDTITIKVNQLPTVTFDPIPAKICQGDSILLSGNGASNLYSWTNGVVDRVWFKPTTTKSYTVTGIDIDGCSNIATTTVVVNPLPTVVAIASLTKISSGMQVTLDGEGAKEYVWDNAVINDVSFVPASTTTYTVTGTDVNGCTNTATTEIFVVNDIPTVLITRPSVDSYISLASVLTIEADATKENGTIDSVAFYVNGAKIGVALTAPYSIDWVVSGSGTAKVTAIAYDNSGKTATAINRFWINEPPFTINGTIPEQIAQKDSTFASINLSSYINDSYTPVANLKLTAESNPYISVSLLNGKIEIAQIDSSWAGTTTINCSISDEQGLKLPITLLCTQPYILKHLLQKPSGLFYSNKMLVKVNESVRFYTSVIAADTVKWNLGGGEQISGFDINPTVKFQNPGVYSITMTAINTVYDTVITKRNYIIVSALSVNDTVLCKGHSLTVSASSGFTTYVWNTNPVQTSASIKVAPVKTTTYKVTMKKGLATILDSVVVKIPKQPELGNDTTFCEGASLQLTPGTFKEYYWNDASTMAYFNAKTAGKITVQTVDTYGCVAKDSVTIKTLYSKPVVNIGNDTTFCWKKKLTLDAGNRGASFLWNNGSKDQTIIADTTKEYSVTVTDKNHCVNSDTIAINVLIPFVPQIGVVTLSSSGNNLIAWESQNEKGVEKYYVWKQTNIVNDFEIIDTIYKNELTVSVDKSSNPKVKSDSYALSLVDAACGNESAKGVVHNSIHLSCVLQNNGTVKASWNNYIGLPISKYIIYRAEKGKSLVAYDTVVYNPNVTKMVYIDENAIGLNSNYQVGFDLEKPVTPTLLKSDSGPFSQSLSNMAESELTDVELTMLDAEIKAFPNPTEGKFVVSIQSSKTKKYTIVLVNALGQNLYEIKTGEISEAKLNIDASMFANGIYMLKIITDEGIATKQIVITR